MKITRQVGALDSLSYSVFSNGIYVFEDNDQFSYNNLIGGIYRGTFKAYDFGPSIEYDNEGNSYPGNVKKTMEVETTAAQAQSITFSDISFLGENKFTASGYNQRIIYACEFTRR